MARRPGTVIRRPDFGRLAADYDRVRPVDDNWLEVYSIVFREADLRGRRVLDCGCGTGRLVARLAADGVPVTGIDAERRMLEAARERVPVDVRLEHGSAEGLPFEDGAFDASVMWLVCHLVDRQAAFGEARRVLTDDGRLAVVTFDPSHFDRFWLNAYFPSLERVDRARFPTEGRLRDELLGAKFETVRFVRCSQRATLGREDALERIAKRHISTFDLLDPEEVEAGRRRAHAELPAVVEYQLEWLIAIAQR